MTDFGLDAFPLWKVIFEVKSNFCSLLMWAHVSGLAVVPRDQKMTYYIMSLEIVR